MILWKESSDLPLLHSHSHEPARSLAVAPSPVSAHWRLLKGAKKEKLQVSGGPGCNQYLIIGCLPMVWPCCRYVWTHNLGKFKGAIKWFHFLFARPHGWVKLSSFKIQPSQTKQTETSFLMCTQTQVCMWRPDDIRGFSSRVTYFLITSISMKSNYYGEGSATRLLMRLERWLS